MATTNEPVLDADTDTNMANEEGMEQGKGDVKATYKSFKKKFRKIKMKFDEAMRLSNTHYVDEQRGKATATRLAQENDQLLELLMDMNNSPQLPVDKRIDISAETPALTPIPALISDQELTSATKLRLSQEGRDLFNEISSMMAEKAAICLASRPPKSLAVLMAKTRHHSVDNPHCPPEYLETLLPEKDEAEPLAYLTADQIDDYTDEIDAQIGTGPPMHSRLPTSTSQEVSFNNLHSPYNWLRRNQPQIFLQDGEGSEKSHGKPGALRGAGKRASIPAPSKPDALEIVEEDGQGYDFAIGGGPATKGNKRKRGGDEDDGSGGYHPKSSRNDDGAKVKKPRATKRKKKEDSDETPAKPGRKKRVPKEKVPSPDTVYGSFEA